MRIGSKSRVLVAVLLGLAIPGIQSGIVSADDPAPAEDAGTHCASEAVPVGSNRTPGPPVCFDSFPDAISYATSGAVELPDGATTVTQQQLDQGAARPNGAAAVKVVIGVSHDGLDWPESPGTLTHWVWNRGCDADPGREYWVNNLGDDWNDRIDSAQGYNRCQGRYFEHANLKGASVSTNWAGGPLEDEATSIAWR
jgi:hypothetical protein